MRFKGSMNAKGAPYFWAKTTADGQPGCTVQEHCMAAGAVADHLVRLLSPKLRAKLALPDGVTTLVALHDIGKISPGFQTKCAQWKGPFGDADEDELYQWFKKEKKHAIVSQWFMEQHLKEKHPKIRAYKPWAQCLGAHHGVFVGVTPNATLDEHWLGYAKELLRQMESRWGAIPEQTPESIWGKEVATTMQEWLIGLIEVSDWIASNEDYFPAEGGCPDFETAAQHALAQIGFTAAPAVAREKTWSELFPHAPTPRPIQQYLWQQTPAPGIYIIEDAMGGGKTEAALGLAYKLMEAGVADGLYFALPTQTTSNRIFMRVLDFLQRAGACVNEKSVRLAHGNSWLVQEELFCGWLQQSPRHADERVPVRNWFASSRRALLARFGIGTIDQALMGEINVKHSFVRRFALAGKVVILDEVHSYDLYTGRLITLLVRHLRQLGATVIILSATLTKARLSELMGADGDFSAYPLASISAENAETSGPIEQTFPAEKQKEIHLITTATPIDTIAEGAYRRAEQGQCVLWLRNTVKEAQETYRIMLSIACEDGPEIGLLHARFPLWRRQELEQSWIDRLGRDGSRRPHGCVLIATQVAEQSLDIDADYLITDTAPADMLLQRAGRLWRHDRPRELRHAEMAEMHINFPLLDTTASTQKIRQALGASRYVYAPYVLLRTQEAWQGIDCLKLPKDIRPLLERTYAERSETNGSPLLVFQRELEKKNGEMVATASNNTDKGLEHQHDTDDASTRYGSIETTDLLLLRSAPEVLSSTQTRYYPLHGEPFVIDSLRWSFRAARCIQENVVRVPQRKIPKEHGGEFISGYNLTCILPVFPLDNSSSLFYSSINGEPVIGWTLDLGACTLETKQDNAHPSDEDDEENEFMY